MQSNLSLSWQSILANEIQKSYFHDLMVGVEEEYKAGICYPPKELIFAAFDYCTFDDLKVVLLGQDPYHGPNEANGLCFSVNEGVKIQPSLRNIFRELNDDLETIFLPNSGDLSHWAKQGVLLLNASLSVRENSPNSHQHLKWNVFTAAVIRKISEQKEGVVFLLWGNFAQKKERLIDASKHLILKSGHPSPMSANQGKWFGNKHFSKTNQYLSMKGKNEIKWNV